MVYFDFGTSANLSEMINPESSNLFAILYVNIFDFHLNLNLDRVILEVGFGNSLPKLGNVSCLKGDMLN